MNNKLIEEFMDDTRKDISAIKVSVKGIEVNVENIVKVMDDHNNRMLSLERGKVDKKDFRLWKRILVSGILITGTIAVLALVIDKYLR